MLIIQWWLFTLTQLGILCITTVIPTYHCYKQQLCFTMFNYLNTLRPRQNGRHFWDNIFKCIFLTANVWILLKISLRFVPKVWINNIPALVQLNGLVSKRRQAIIWTKVDPVQWHIYASPGLSGLNGNNELWLSSNPSSTETGIIQENYINILAADALPLKFISSHGIQSAGSASPSLPWGSVLSTCDISL